MIVTQENNIALITQEKASIIELVKKLQVLYERFKNNNIIVNLSALDSIPSEQITEFLQLSKTHKAQKKSFVIVAHSVDIDTIPNQISVVPTLQEAYDLVEMEDIERDLDL